MTRRRVQGQGSRHMEITGNVPHLKLDFVPWMSLCYKNNNKFQKCIKIKRQ